MKKKKNLLKRNSGFLVGCVLAAGASFFTADLVMSQKLSLILTPEDETEKETEGKSDLPKETEAARTYETDPFTITASGTVIKGVETEKQSETETKESETDENGNPVSTPETDENGNPVSTPETDENGNPVSTPETDENGNPVSAPETDENGNPAGGSGTGDGADGNGSSQTGEDSSGSGSQTSSGDGGSSSGDGSGSYDGPVIEIQDSWNSDYYYDDDSSWTSGGSWDSGSGSSSSGDGGSSWDSGSGSSSSGGDQSGGNDSAWTPEDVILWGISSRYIDESELYNYDLATLRLIRNEIFALHGRIFRSQDLVDYFSQKSWYVPTYDPDAFDADMFYYLNDYEEANLKVILNYEAALAGYQEG